MRVALKTLKPKIENIDSMPKKDSKLFCVVIPIHNEEKFLPISLPSVYDLTPHEVILLFDRCTDNSITIAKTIAKRYGMLNHTQFIEIGDDIEGFTMRFAYMRWLGCVIAHNNTILITAADLVLDKQIVNHLGTLGNNDVELVSFLHKDYPVDFRNLLKRLLVKTKIGGLGQQRWLGPVLLFDRNTSFELEDFDGLKRLESAEDTHLQQAINTHHKSLCIVSNTIHLRPRFGSRDYLCGRLYWSVAHRSFLMAFLNMLFMFRLNLIKGYIHERYGDTENE